MPKKINQKKVKKAALLLGIGTSRVLEALSADDGELIARKKALELAMEEWKNRALKQAEQASTIQEAKEAHCAAPAGSEAHDLALKKWINFCSTIQELREVFIIIPSGEDEAKSLAIKKLYKLL